MQALKKENNFSDLVELFLIFFKIGLFTIGGGMAMIPLIKAAVVDNKKWMNNEEMMDCIALSQSMPGVVAINAATYVGRWRKGMPGALAATIGVIIPSFVIIICAILFLGTLGENRVVDGVFLGVKAASCALILYSAYSLARASLKGWFQRVFAVVGFVAIVFFDITAAWIILAAIFAGIIYISFSRQEKEAPK